MKLVIGFLPFALTALLAVAFHLPADRACGIAAVQLAGYGLFQAIPPRASGLLALLGLLASAVWALGWLGTVAWGFA